MCCRPVHFPLFLSQSHEPEFDYLKSLEIEEKINRIKWCKRQNSAHFLLSTNGACGSGSDWLQCRGWRYSGGARDLRTALI